MLIALVYKPQAVSRSSGERKTVNLVSSIQIDVKYSPSLNKYPALAQMMYKDGCCGRSASANASGASPELNPVRGAEFACALAETSSSIITLKAYKSLTIVACRSSAALPQSYLHSVRVGPFFLLLPVGVRNCCAFAFTMRQVISLPFAAEWRLVRLGSCVACSHASRTRHMMRSRGRGSSKRTSVVSRFYVDTPMCCAGVCALTCMLPLCVAKTTPWRFSPPSLPEDCPNRSTVCRAENYSYRLS